MSATIQVRTIRVEARQVGDAELDVTGRLVDERPRGGPRWVGLDRGTTIHDMSLTLRVRYPDLTITAVSGTMATFPYTVCGDAVPPLQQLVGLSVAQGFTRAVNERFGRERGCAHLTALIQAMAPVVRQGAGAAFRDEDAPSGGEADHWFVDTCQAWRARGPLHERLRAGDVDGLRALTAGRPASPSPDRRASG
jgi:hypothetical protein